MSRTLLDDCYDHSVRLTKRTAGNFYYSFMGLPAPQFRAMCALYAFMRVTDDWGDDEARSIEQRLADLETWEHSLKSVLQPEWSVTSMSGWTEPARMILPAMADVTERFAIPHEHLFAVIRGVRSDLAAPSAPLATRFHTFDELADYCYLVAGAVGLCCIHIWGFHGTEAISRAIDCGTAFQLTNILRDVGEDATAGRVYLPAEDLQRFGVTVEDLAAHRCDERFRELMAFEAERARAFYASAEQLVPHLDPHGRPIMKAMLQLYGGLLGEIERRQFDIFKQHVSLPRWRKLWIAADALIHQTLLPK